MHTFQVIIYYVSESVHANETLQESYAGIYMQARADERIGNETRQERDTMKLATMQGHCRQEICTHACICKCSVIMGERMMGKIHHLIYTPFRFFWATDRNRT